MAGPMDRACKVVLSAPRAAMVPVVIWVALAVRGLLWPTIFLPKRCVFDRLMEFLELVLGRPARPSEAA